MPLEIRAIRERRKVCTVELGEGAAIEMEYLPAKASSLDRETIAALATESAGKPAKEQRKALAALLCDVLIRWDVTQDGAPFPLAPDVMASELDDAFLGFCLAAIVQDANAGKVTGELLSLLGTVTISRPGAGKSSPDTKAAAFHPKRS